MDPHNYLVEEKARTAACLTRTGVVLVAVIRAVVEIPLKTWRLMAADIF
jgi:hypothetical protein